MDIFRDIYELRLFDTPLLRFRFGVENPVHILEISPETTHLLPFGLTPTDDGLWRWLATRAIPQNRRFADVLCRTLGMSSNDRSQILTICRGLSLNDSYWICAQGDDSSFNDVNLFDNGFSSVLAAVAYTGIVSNMHGLTPETPELTTNGALRKAWRALPESDTYDKKPSRYLYKGSSVQSPHIGEARVEFLASQVARAMGLDVVEYNLGFWDQESTEPSSICECFCSKYESYAPYASIFGDAGHSRVAANLINTNLEWFERYASMMVFDSLIYNTDRHLTNFGLLFDANNRELIKFAPVFDNGHAMFFNLKFEQVDDFAIESRFASPTWAQVTFDEQAARLMGDLQKEELSRLEGFEFLNSEAAPMPEEFLKSASRFIRERAKELLRLPAIDRSRLQEAACPLHCVY
jgi:hypothetical protein